MTIRLDNAGKRYNRDWIFRNLTYTFQSGTGYSITGSNGSGKSTLLQLISGAISVSEGTCNHILNGKRVPNEKVFSQIALCAPYLELIEELTLKEFLRFHQSFKPFLETMSVDAMIRAVDLDMAKHKKINEYSSGMKQRVKLAQCIFSQAPVVLLDEPCTNLDTEGIALYHQLVETYCRERLVLVCSNDITEYGFCTENISIGNYK